MNKVVVFTILIILFFGIVVSSGCISSDDVKQNYEKFQEEHKQLKHVDNTNQGSTPAPQEQDQGQQQEQEPVQQPQPQEELNQQNEEEEWSGVWINKGGRYIFNSPFGIGIMLVPKAGRMFVTASEETADFVPVIYKNGYYYLVLGFEGEAVDNHYDSFLKSLEIVIKNAKIVSVIDDISYDYRGGEDDKGKFMMMLTIKFKTRNPLRTGDKINIKIYSNGIDLAMIDAPMFVDDVKNSIYTPGNIPVGGTYKIGKNKIKTIYFIDTILIDDKTTSNILLVRDDEKVGTYYLFMIVKTDDEKPIVVPFHGGGLTTEFEVKKATKIWSNYYIKLTLQGQYETGDWIDIKISINDLDFRVHSQVTVVSEDEFKQNADLIDTALLFIQKMFDIAYANTSY